jgi:dihydroorotate dehydrogenase electron transfer subunit
LFVIKGPIKEIIPLDNNIFVQKIYAPDISAVMHPGQFLNIKVTETIYPLLRRPFSICDYDGDYIYIMFNIFGEGTKMLAGKKIDDQLDILGPLGKGFNTEGDYDTAVIVAGGLGAAPFPALFRRLGSRNIMTFIGGRSHKDVIKYKMINYYTATDDGSEGIKGNVIDLLNKNIDKLRKDKIKIFACGPNAMLRALKEFCIEHNFNCEASTECAMACGFGICQGCPIESTHEKDKYLLVCKDGPVFNVMDVII